MGMGMGMRRSRRERDAAFEQDVERAVARRLAERTRLVVVIGTRGPERTAVATRLSDAHDAIRIDLDQWLVRLGHALDDLEERDRLEPLTWAHAEELLLHHVPVVVVSGPGREPARDRGVTAIRARGIAAHLHVVDAGLRGSDRPTERELACYDSVSRHAAP